MNIVRVGAATLNQTPLAWKENLGRVLDAIAQAQAQKVDLLCLPELCLSGYGCEDWFLSVATANTALESLIKLLPSTAGIAVLVGLPIYFEGSVLNCAALVQNGHILGLHAKKNLPRDGVHYEPRWFRPWNAGELVDFEIGAEVVPLGDLVFECGGVNVGIEICEEAWGATSSAAAASGGLDIVLNPSASHFALGKVEAREHLVANLSRAMGVAYVYSNLVGLEAGRIIYDGGALIAKCGEFVARSKKFGFNDGDFIAADIDVDALRAFKLRQRSVSQRGGNQGSSSNQELHPHAIVGAKFGGAEVVPLKDKKNLNVQALDRHHEFLAAEMTGLFDYLRKAKAKGFVVPLSGGCDSAVCAVLIAHMIAEALKELGPEILKKRLALPQMPGDSANPRAWIKTLLTCVYMGTNQSSEKTSLAAKNLALEIGAEFFDIPVQAFVKDICGSVEKALHRKMSWTTDDLTLQNVQARARAPVAWMIANIQGAILITTSNRSEAAVGYATMDGDMAGGLAPLGGIDKHFLREWLRWAETGCGIGLGPINALGAINSLAPSAELRPHTSDQTDEADLMPYQVLERIERLYVRDKLPAAAIVERVFRDRLELGCGTQTLEAMTMWVERFERLWRQNQWKRERMAPSFYVDDESVDSRTWCRHPILSADTQDRN